MSKEDTIALKIAPTDRNPPFLSQENPLGNSLQLTTGTKHSGYQEQAIEHIETDMLNSRTTVYFLENRI
jgi:hypothetical protein